MSSLVWYWHRLKAMSPAELAAHSRRKACQLSDSLRGGRRFDGLEDVEAGEKFPRLPLPDRASVTLRAALAKDTTDILAGRWVAFGHLKIQVDDPPLWHKDYLAGIELATDKPALKLHHRLEGKADIKLIWEPSRWYSLVRLAQAAYVLGDQRAAAACMRILGDWADHNPPFYGWNWTSALESGLRLIQFCWIDALLTSAGVADSVLTPLRTRLLPPHLWFTWRDRSFGSSANNHLIGELAGLVLSVVRWPGLSRWAAPLDTLQPLWEKQVLTQFAPDGGNREQALNYHLFSWEFCWQARLALQAAGRAIAPEVEDRLRAAVDFFTAVQARDRQWDYGDSDSAYVAPLFAEWKQATTEWYRWFGEPAPGSNIGYWIGDPPESLRSPAVVKAAHHWLVYPASGYAVCRTEDWFLRWDLSPLGYLATASHGHCDALHLSVWFHGDPVLIDPGTGAYHADRPLRDYLSSWQAHNGPHPVNADFPQRRGTFLWSGRHALPRWEEEGDFALSGELRVPSGVMKRIITYLPDQDGWRIEDAFQSPDSHLETEVFWQFAPDAVLDRLAPSEYHVRLNRGAIRLQLDAGWKTVGARSSVADRASAAGAETKSLRGVCSPAFRVTTTGPYLSLRAPVNSPNRLRTLLRPG